MEIFDQPDTVNTQFAELLLPVPIPKLFTYRVPHAFNDHVLIGQRAIVQFGDRKIVTGIILSIHQQAPKDYEAKYILELLDNFPSVNDLQLRLFQWMADYYLCTLGEVMNAALPSGLKLSSESMVQLHPAFNLDESNHAFSEKELILLKRLQHESLAYSDIAKLLGTKHLYTILKSLTGKEAIILFEEVKEKYRPKTEKKIRLTAQYATSDALEKLFNLIASKPKQEDVVLKYLQHVSVIHHPEANKDGLSKKKLLTEEISESSLSTLVKNNVFEEFDIIVPRFDIQDKSDPPLILLSEEQERAQAAIFKSFESHTVALLHGITGSGKTEIYINLIRKALDSNTQVLYLLPEIALTTQIVHRLKKVFGSAMGIYHSKFSDAERVEVWNGVLQGKFNFIVGVRSSIFLPFDNLGLIIVDEEHDSSYKQQDPAPRYNARDVALMMAQMHHAKVLLGSATPSIESYYQTQQGKYGLIELNKRFGDAQLPQVMLADMGRERKQKTVKGEFSGLLLKKIDEALKLKEQVIIFQNRRGYSPMVNCEDCGWVPKCVNCAVSLTYHQFRNALVCHYCGYKESLPQQCPTCTSTRIKTVGYGTEKLEEELSLHFAEAQVQRMDLDTTRSKNGYETIIDQFERGETNILVGTQMVTKGLDFDHVSLVGIFNADRMIHFPDFRSYERAFQLITQVSGRAGRRDKPGLVVIQTSGPDHPLLKTILKHNYKDFFNTELADRQLHDYPPFTRLIEITVKHTDKKICKAASETLADQLKQNLSYIRILGPGEPAISKIRNQFLMNILLKVPRGKFDLANIKKTIVTLSTQLVTEKEFRSVRVMADVDPM
ncbi:replication restart helicase PriA [Ohtaekwangia koreensis]|uniref:Replication restart protein PriA n=1 Tax=Ohtaekwangia koreensis TaxID=688867 RepID=A0A1T5JVS0_9BACT|nr:primosomal protein N' [Ohtaekwangia koreensis]SKC55465.1 replication restart DNA helicase PriA [Ohtaekwangia koreensis]